MLGAGVQALRSDGQGGFTDVTSVYFDQQPVNHNTDVIDWLHFVDINSDGAVDIVADTFYGQIPYINDGTGHYIRTQAPRRVRACMARHRQGRQN